MCFRKWGSLVESYFCGNRVQLCRKERVWGEFVFLQTKNCFLAKWKVPKENVKFQFSAHKNILDNSKKHRFTSVSCSAKAQFCTKLSLQPTPFFPFHRNKDNVQFPFSSTTCGIKHALQHRFFAKPDSAFNEKPPFSTGSKHGRAYLRH